MHTNTKRMCHTPLVAETELGGMVGTFDPDVSSFRASL